MAAGTVIRTGCCDPARRSRRSSSTLCSKCLTTRIRSRAHRWTARSPSFTITRDLMAPSGSPILMFPTIQTTPPRFPSAPSAARIDPAWQTTIAPLVAYLRTQQFTGQNGWHPDDPVYGAWGMGGGRRTPPNTGHVDLSMTRYVLNALHAAGAPDSDPAFAAARIFVERCQNLDDGGFFLHHGSRYE